MPVLPDHPISNRRRYDLFGTLPIHGTIPFFVFLAKNVIIFARGGPIVYRLGHGLFKAGSGVRLSVGS